MDPEIRGRIRIHRGDITRLEVDAIVNAANERLAPGGGVCGAIHRAAGPSLAEECARIGPCPTGEARITNGYELPAPRVIHAVGPVWHGGGSGEADLLAGAYQSALGLACDESLATVAFPAISTGIYGYPLEAATRIAVDTVAAWLEREALPRAVTFAVVDDSTEGAYRAVLERA
jgi:O-acetyl-ADP-ribose deacetylase (regulator of RNase III)